MVSITYGYKLGKAKKIYLEEGHSIFMALFLPLDVYNPLSLRSEHAWIVFHLHMEKKKKKQRIQYGGVKA